MRCHHSNESFTLVELLATIAIMAVLIVGAIYYTASYIQWAKQTTEKEIYTVLNDELTRYKSGGGNIATLTLGAPFNDIFAALQTPVVPAGMPASFSQQFMATNYTYPGRSLQATGTGQQYHFYQVDQYVGQTPAAGTATTKYPYGYGVGYMSNGGNAAGYAYFCIWSSSGYYTCQPSGGSIQVYASQSWIGLGVANSYTFWSSDASGNPSGNILTLYCGNYDYLTSLNVSSLTSLTSLDCDSNQLSSLNVSGMTALTYLNCRQNNAGMTINIKGDTALPAQCTGASQTTNFWTDASAVVTGP
jgi:type II secretory pathway pseudopilin PulG